MKNERQPISRIIGAIPTIREWECYRAKYEKAVDEKDMEYFANEHDQTKLEAKQRNYDFYGSLLKITKEISEELGHYKNGYIREALEMDTKEGQRLNNAYSINKDHFASVYMKLCRISPEVKSLNMSQTEEEPECLVVLLGHKMKTLKSFLESKDEKKAKSGKEYMEKLVHLTAEAEGISRYYKMILDRKAKVYSREPSRTERILSKLGWGD